MIGFCLGGGSSSFNGLKGLAIDNLLSVRVITATGSVLNLSPNSSGQGAELFNVLCGAGLGFGVITSLILRAWRVAELQMPEDMVWTRKLIFPPPAIQTAANLFAKLQHCEPRMAANMVFQRAPPSAA